MQNNQFLYGKFILMKNYLTPGEIEIVKVLKSVPGEGMFTSIVRKTAREGKVDSVRSLFKMLREQAKGAPYALVDAIGVDAFDVIVKM